MDKTKILDTFLEKNPSNLPFKSITLLLNMRCQKGYYKNTNHYFLQYYDKLLQTI